LGFVDAEFFTNYGYAGKPFKGSKDVDFSLVSKKTWAKNWLIGLAHRAR